MIFRTIQIVSFSKCTFRTLADCGILLFLLFLFVFLFDLCVALCGRRFGEEEDSNEENEKTDRNDDMKWGFENKDGKERESEWRASIA